jgi:hypothetical protein
VTTLKYSAFYGCTALTRLSLSPAVSVAHNTFSNCTALISAAASQNMSTIEDLLHSRWHRIRERVTVLTCLKESWDPPRRSAADRKRKRQDGVEAPAALRVTEAREKIPKVLWREILEFL